MPARLRRARQIPQRARIVDHHVDLVAARGVSSAPSPLPTRADATPRKSITTVLAIAVDLCGCLRPSQRSAWCHEVELSLTAVSTEGYAPRTDRYMRTLAEIGGREPQAEEVRARVLAAAEAVFAERGYAGATTREIAERAGIGKRMLFYYLTKDAVYRAVLEHPQGLSRSTSCRGTSRRDRPRRVDRGDHALHRPEPPGHQGLDARDHRRRPAPGRPHREAPGRMYRQAGTTVARNMEAGIFRRATPST